MAEESNKFKNAMGNRYLRAMFFEETLTDKSSVVYTLKDQDHMGYPSLYRLYMEEADPTEYRFATKYLDGWEHWQQLAACTWFKPYIDRWREELKVKLQSEYLARIMVDARNGNIKSNQYLLEEGWVPKNTKGRPKKEDVAKAAKEKAEAMFKINSDFERILGNRIEN